MPNTVWYSCSPFETGDIKTGSPTITISSGVATLSVAQTGNIGCGDCIEYASTAVYIAPNRLGFDSGGTTEIKVGDKIQGATSGATGIIRAVELTSGSWSGGDAAGYFYFEQTTGTWQDNETINRIRPSSASNVATVNGTLQGNIGNGNTQFVVKTATGGTPSDQSSTSVTSIHHEYASLVDLEAGFTDANHLNSTDLTSAGADVIVHACCYYDHSDYTADSPVAIDFGTTDTTHYFFTFTPMGNNESINKQRHDGKWNSQRYEIVGSSDSAAFQFSMKNIWVDGLLLQNTKSGNNSRGVRFVTYGSGLGIKIANTIIKAATGITGDDPLGINLPGASSDEIYIWNVIIQDFESSGGTGKAFYAESNGIKAYIYNVSVVNCENGFYGGGNEYTLIRNCLAQSCTDGFVGTFDSDSDYNCSDISGDAPGANSVTGTVSFVDTANDNYHLASSDTVAKDAGYDLSTDPYLPIWRDIDGEDRVGGTWDIGADEYVATGGAGAIMNQFQKSNLGADLFNGSLL